MLPDAVQSLKNFLQKDENFLGVLLALTNLSQEKFLRIITAQRFANQDFAPEWGVKEIYRRIRKDDSFAEQIARLFLELEFRQNAILPYIWWSNPYMEHHMWR
ncbi:MAG: hypothetical protein ACK44E_11310, partial [Anaerolineales bacterium]